MRRAPLKRPQLREELITCGINTGRRAVLIFIAAEGLNFKKADLP